MRVLLAGNQPQDRDRGRRAALRAGLECANTDCVSLADLRFRLAREPGVHLVVVYCDSEPDTAARAIKTASELTQQPIYAVIASDATTSQPDGVAGVWAPERVQEEMVQTADALRRSGRVPDNRGRVVAVTAAQGGTGVTTVATGLAFAMVKSGPVALAEFPSGTPSVALNLDLKPRHSVADLIQASERVDVSMIREAATRHAAGVDILAYSQEVLVAEPITPAIARDFQVLLRSAFPWSIVDAGDGIGAAAENLFAHADAVVVVTRLDPPGLRLTRRYVLALTEHGVPVDAICIVANRYGQPGLVPWAKAEEALRAKVAAWLPDDVGAVNRALRDGRPLSEVARWAKLTRELSRLASALQTRLTAPVR